MTSIVVGKDRINLLESERFIAGTKQVYKMKVSFSDDWCGMDKKVVFKTDCFEIGVDIVKQSETIPLPTELFSESSNKLQVGAYGCKCGQKILNTRWLSLGRIWKGSVNSNCGCGCDTGIPSTPSLVTYQQLKELIDQKADRMTYEDGQFILWSGDEPLSSFDAPISLPEGGEKGQVLVKASDEDGDYAWETIASGPAVALNIPIGSIIAWSGTLDTIPEGYSLCDGQNGTRDLRNSFLIGAGLDLAPGDTNAIKFSTSARSRVAARNLTPDEVIDPDIMVDPARAFYYALAFIQKTSFTESDLREGKTAYELAVEMGFNGTIEDWLESLKGDSAYEIAKENGFEGTEEEFARNLSSALTVLQDLLISRRSELPVQTNGVYHLKNVELGPSPSKKITDDLAYIDVSDPSQIVLTLLSGERVICECAPNGIITNVTTELIGSGEGSGEAGKPGKPGASAYEIAVLNGFEGTEEEWLESLKGSDGKSAYEIAKENGFAGSEAEWLESLKGSDGKSAYDIAKENGFEGSEADWLESLKGKDGTDGEAGADGKSAYQIAVDNGFTGTEAEWLESLKGEKGDPGVGEGDSVPGPQGEPGKSAYEIAKENGFTGSEAEWLESLKGQDGQNGNDGADGKSAYDIAKENGFTGSEAEWLESLKGQDGADGANGENGADGKSAYDIAKENGFTGSEAEWLESLKGQNGADGTNGENGADGADGKSAYQIAVDNGFEGDEAAWLESLKGQDGADGADGKSAYQIAVDNGFTGTEAEWLESLKGEKGDPGTGGDGSGKPYLVLNAQMDSTPEVGNPYPMTSADFNRTPEADEPLSGIVTVPGTVELTYYVHGTVTAVNETTVTFDKVVRLTGASGSGEGEAIPGPQGEPGKSAYDLAVEQGFQGSLDDWLNSLTGEPGQDGQNGADGKSAYEIAVDTGFDGSEAEWIASLKGEDGQPGAAGEAGADGKSAYEVAVDNGFTGTEEEWLESLKGATGAKGKSAYQIAVDNGFEGDEAAWLESLKGQKGDTGNTGADGKSAYDLAVESGYEGTLQQWLDSLKGEGIAEFVTYADSTITSREILSAVDVGKAVHVKNCRFAAADGNSLQFNDEMLYIVPHDLSLDIYRANGELVQITFGEDEVFSTLTVTSFGGSGTSNIRPITTEEIDQLFQ